MATKTTKRKTNITKKPGFRLGMIASGIMIVLALIVLSIWFTTRSLFDRNDHFKLKNIVVRSGGWWDKRSKKVSEILEIKRGETNLFAIDLAEKRKLLEAEPSISKASISRHLPDTLSIEIMERMPKAYLYRQEKGLLVDQEGIVMSIDSCITVDGSLPVITGFDTGNEPPAPGKKLHQVISALKLLKMASKEVRGVMFRRINVRNDAYYNCNIYLPRYRKQYQLYISHKDLKYKLEVLNELLKTTPLSEPNATIIDLRYEEQAVVK